jgi:hypothetical protein
MNVNKLDRIQEQQLESASLSEQCRHASGQQKQTPEEYEKVKERNRERKQNSRAQQTPEEHEKIKERDRERKQNRRAQQTLEKQEEVKEQNREQKQKSRAQQTLEKQEEVKEQNREQKQKSRAQQTPEEHEKERQLNLNRERKAPQTQAVEVTAGRSVSAQVDRPDNVISCAVLKEVEKDKDIKRFMRPDSEIYKECAERLSLESLTYNCCAVCQRNIQKMKTTFYAIDDYLVQVRSDIRISSIISNLNLKVLIYKLTIIVITEIVF